MDIESWKARKKELNLTFDELAEISGVSRRQLLYLFNGNAKNTGIETVQRIERALGLDAPAPEVSKETQQLFALLHDLTEDELEELTSFVDFIISKRK